MGVRCLKKLHAQGHPDITICNRTHSTATQLAERHSIETRDFNTILKELHTFDIIISAITLKTHFIQKEHLSTQKNQLLIDLGLPRNINPELDTHSNVKLINVDGLKQIAEKNIVKRKKEVEHAQAIIDEDIHNFNQWLSYKQKHVTKH